MTATRTVTAPALESEPDATTLSKVVVIRPRGPGAPPGRTVAQRRDEGFETPQAMGIPPVAVKGNVK